MIVSWGNKAAKELYESGYFKKMPKELVRRADILLQFMMEGNLNELLQNGQPPSLRPHKLKGLLKDFMAIDIHELSGWRITFKYINNEFHVVKIENYH